MRLLSIVTSYDKPYLWLLARTPTVSDALLEWFVCRAAELGFESDKLIFPKQN